MLYNKKPTSANSNEVDGEGAEIDTDTILVAGIARGLNKADAESMTLGMWVDFIITHNNMVDEANADKPKQRKATQSDFDNF